MTATPSQKAPSSLSSRWRAFVLLCCLALTFFSASKINGSSLKGDAMQNLTIGYNLYHGAGFSLDGPQGLEPSNFREPVPPLLIATYLKLFGGAREPMSLESMHYGVNTRFIKLSNLFWVFLGLLGSWSLFYQVTRQPALATLTLLLSFPFFFGHPLVVNSFYTELQTASLMLCCSALLLQLLKAPRALHLFGGGVLLGLCALTKSIFLPIALLMVILLSLLYRPDPMAPSAWRHGRMAFAAVLLLGLASTVGPWMLRNQIVTSSSEITAGRTGYILMKRAMLDQITDDEFKAGFYLFGPRLYRQLVAGTSLDVQADEAVKRGGRLQRLNGGMSEFIAADTDAINAGKPEQAISFYRKAAAVHSQLTHIFEQAGHAHPKLAADRVMQKVALSQIAQHPLAHLKVSLLMFWRGFWCFSPSSDIPGIEKSSLRGAVVVILNAAAGLALLGVFGWGLLRRRPELILMTAMPVLMMMLYTLLTQNLPRFFSPAVPAMLMSLIWLCAAPLRNAQWSSRAVRAQLPTTYNSAPKQGNGP